MLTVQKIPQNHYALANEQDAQRIFKAQHGREAGESDIKVYHRQAVGVREKPEKKDGKKEEPVTEAMYFVECVR